MPDNRAQIEVSRPAQGVLCVHLGGCWRVAASQPSVEAIGRQIGPPSDIKTLFFDSHRLEGWDSSLLAFLVNLKKFCTRMQIQFDPGGIPEGLAKLLALATAVPEKTDARRQDARESVLSRVGVRALAFKTAGFETLTFIGAAFTAMLRLPGGRARFRQTDLALHIQECGVRALPIVTLISVLVGLILAFVGAVQLQMFGAQIYVANLVGLGMAREMGAMMAAIIMAGRTGAAYAAQLGTMQVNEEIDALETMGIAPMEYLVLPRMLALMLMMPLLCLYANFLGIVGGALVGIVTLDISPLAYFNQTREAVELWDFGTGLIKSVLFGILIAVAGCMRGMQCGRSASAVGDATTSAVVTAIVLIIVSDAVMTVVYNTLGI